MWPSGWLLPRPLAVCPQVSVSLPPLIPRGDEVFSLSRYSFFLPSGLHTCTVGLLVVVTWPGARPRTSHRPELRRTHSLFFDLNSPTSDKGAGVPRAGDNVNLGFSV